MKILTHGVVLDDQRLFAESFSLLLKREHLIDLVQPLNQINEFLDFLRTFGEHELYVFLDYHLHEGNGLALLPDIRRLNTQAKVIYVTSNITPTIIQNIQRYHPEGILSKSCGTNIVIACLNSIKQGKPYIDPEIERLTANNSKKTPTFTPRELELLKYFSQGHSIAGTAALTSLSPHTIVSHRRKMMAKANCHTIAEMLTYANNNKLL